MSTIVERIPLERIRDRAGEISLGRALLTLVVGALWLIGWAARMVCRVIGYAFSWSAAAVLEGWDSGKRKPTQGDGGV